jgi:hypothetical protein
VDVVVVTRWEKARSPRRWDLVTWLFIFLAVMSVVIVAIQLLYPIFLAQRPDFCEPLFPDLQLPTLGVEQ